jgi:hypothetical protein
MGSRVGRRKRWTAAAIAMVLLLGLVQGSAPQPGDRGGSDGGAGGLTGLWDSLRRMFGEPGPAAKPADTALLTLPVRQPAPTGRNRVPASRVRELTAKRTESAAFYQLSDGGVEAAARTRTPPSS